MEEYQCAKCLRNFPVKRAIDGYSQGFKCGFLCPLCGANLVEAGQSDDIDHCEYGYRYALLVFIVTSIVVRGGDYFPWQLHVFKYEAANEILLVFSLLLLPSLLFLKVNAKTIFGARLIFTRKLCP